MKVWIDQDLCTGDGLREEIYPEVFTLLDDGLSYVKDVDRVMNQPGGAQSLVAVATHLVEALRDAAEECQEECVFIEQGGPPVAWRISDRTGPEGIAPPSVNSEGYSGRTLGFRFT